uniref:regulation of nuclear pre-mRNA domain-containing protein 1A n=1 Tax=Erigeron canadensis TaxID=72917 RepID=UPI001CB9B8D2|nr:regulation of nuclear pre-mRNA domain-containing protein 1A [Erigeron canadensis]
MGSAFNPQILVEKLAKLNSSQQSIETLSHWCIFHMNKAKQVVETWAKQFHCSPRDQRLAFLYLANDILQNSRRKGAEFVGEFWKVLPDALRDVIDHGDESGRNSALRLVNILDERKVFGSRGQVLKEELVGRHRETSDRNGKQLGTKLPAGNALDKIVSGYQTIYASQVNEDAVIGKCRNAISCVEKVDKEIGGDIKSANGSGVVDELKGQHAALRECIQQLTAAESSRINLMSYLRDALQEQETKLDLVRSQLQAAHVQSEKADNLCRQLGNPNGIQSPPDQAMKETHPPNVQGYVPVTCEQPATVMYTRQTSHPDDTKSAAAAVAAKLTASTSSAEMLTYVLSSLASEGVIRNSIKESPSNDYPSKRNKIQNDQPQPYIPSPQNAQPPAPPFPHPESQDPPPPPPSSPPPMPPMPPMQPYPMSQFMQSPGTVPYAHGMNQQTPTMSMPGFPPAGPPTNGVSSYPDNYQNYQIEGGFYSQQPAMPMAPRQ